jgi:hypothetical protein
MVDQAKRNTLIMLGGTAVVSAVPALATAGSLCGTHKTGELAAESTIVPVASEGTELSIQLNIDDESSLTITNNTNKLIIVRHLHPGIVHAGRKTFDVNSVFERSAYAIGAGRSRTMPITETQSTQAELKYPRDTRNRLRVAKLVAHSSEGLMANSTRSFYA